tara:strand:- start:935 stop:2539 length:1605 start_codon:yes stop_codon:yes gene_type:complete
MNKEVSFGNEARVKMQEGINILADSVKCTLGPRGRHAAIEQKYGPPLITKDGVTVAKSINLEDKLMNMGVQLIKSVASKTNISAGDGTTTATVLAQEIYNHGSKMMAMGYNPVLIKRGMDKATEFIVEYLNGISVNINDEESIKSVATISANNDLALGNLISEVIINIGENGLITVEEGGIKTEVEYTEGLNIDRGYLSPTFVNNQSKMRCDFKDPFVLIYDGSLSLTQDIVPIMEKVSETGKPLVVIAKEINSEAMQTLIYNSVRGSLPSCALKAPGFGDIRREMMEDIALVTGGVLFTDETNGVLKTASLEDLGKARKVVVERNKTTIIDGYGDKISIENKISNLKGLLKEGGLFDYQIASLKDRLSKLSGGVALLKVGGLSEAEVKEKKDRIEDSINAVKAALDSGIVSGGGSSLLYCIKPLKTHHNSLLSQKSLTAEESVGFSIIEKALKAPFVQIMKNSGVEHHVIMEKIINSKNNKSGYDALSLKYQTDMISIGVIDPVKVVITALENASSAIGILLTTEVAIYCHSE